MERKARWTDEFFVIQGTSAARVNGTFIAGIVFLLQNMRMVGSGNARMQNI